ncbi:MAG: hypothetical protein ABIC68_08345 [Candidatus Omnitrophota bacterium]
MPVMRSRLLKVFFYLSVGMFFVAVGGAAKTVNQDDLNINRISGQSLDGVRNLKILFGHQSIGMNTIAGLRDLARQNAGYSLVIANVSSLADFNSPKLGHFRISVNGNPIGKIYEFADWIENGYGQVVDVALFKFCPFDIKADTDVVALFNTYKRVMASLKVAYPDVAFVYVTCPLVDSEDLANVKRNQFNRMLLNEYGSREYIFDIAAIESGHQNGTRAEFTFRGGVYNKLCGEYRVAQDRVHLNEVGRQRVAKGMLSLLSTIAEKKQR